MRSYKIRYGGLLLGRVSATVQRACYFRIVPEDPPGKEFCFHILLGGLTFRVLLSLRELGLQEEDDKWVLLKYGLEETERALRDGNERDGHEILLLHANSPGGNLPNFPEISNDDRTRLRMFLEGEEMSYSVP